MDDHAELPGRDLLTHPVTGNYIAAAQAAKEAFIAAAPEGRFQALSAWEEIAYAMRMVGKGTPHPNAIGVLEAIEGMLATASLTPQQAAMLRARRLRHYCWAAAWDPEYEAEAAAEVEAARQIGSPEVLVYALFALHTAIESDVRRAERLPQSMSLSAEMVAAASKHPSPIIRAMANWRRYVDCLVGGDSVGRDGHLDALIEACEESGDRHWHMVATMCRADLEISSGRYRRGEELLESLREGAREFPGVLTAAVSTLSAILRGQTARTGPGAPLSRAATGSRVLHPAFMIGLAYYLAISGRPTEARIELEDIDLQSLARDNGYLPCIAMMVEMAVDSFEDSEMAADAYRRLLPYRDLVIITGPGQGTWGPASLYLGRAARFLGMPEARDFLRQARKTAAAMRARPWLGLALLNLGAIELDAGNSQGEAMIEEALAIAESTGFVPLATRARAALRDTTEPSPRRRAASTTTELSPREREVLSLTAMGHTAAEVADMLVLSRRTVEKHLEHAYGKIGARNRAEGISWAIVNGLTQDQ